MNNARLIDLVNHLPAGTLLSTTPELEKRAGRKLSQASILQACSLVIEVGFQDNEAELSPDGQTIKVYAGGKWFPWPAFTVHAAPSTATGTTGERGRAI